MEAKTINSYGGVKANGLPPEDPETDIADDEWNRLAEDSAQTTQSVARGWVRFLTVSGGSLPYTLPSNTIAHNTVWGSGDSSRPTIIKTATGRYTVTFSTPQTDALGAEEVVSVIHAMSSAVSSDPVDDVNAKVLTRADNVITLKTITENTAPPALADVGNSSGDPFEVELLLR